MKLSYSCRKTANHKRFAGTLPTPTAQLPRCGPWGSEHCMLHPTCQSFGIWYRGLKGEGLQERLVSTHPAQARNPRHTPPPLANCSYTTPADGCVLVHQGKEAGVPGPQRQGKKKLALKSGLKTHLHYLEDDFKSACRWVIAGHTLASAIAQNYITMNFLGDSPCPGFPSRM